MGRGLGADWRFALIIATIACYPARQGQIKCSFSSSLSLQRHKGGKCIILSGLDWKINKDTVVRPDMMIVGVEPKTDFLEFPPVLILEIFSPATRVKDRNIKFELYREQGVRYYLIADYERQVLEVYELRDNVYREVPSRNFMLEPGCEVSIDEAALWE